jgi:arginyl-tRNA synthetase
VLTADLRRAIGRAAAAPVDPGLRSSRTAGVYASSAPFTLAEIYDRPAAAIAADMAARLAAEPWIESAEVTDGYLTITVTRQALAEVPARVARAGPGSVRSDALAGRVVPAVPEADLDAAGSWLQARDALAAELNVRLSVAAGASVAGEGSAPGRSGNGFFTEVSRGLAYAGADAVRFALAAAPPGRPPAVDPLVIARHVTGNPAYAVRYAHARAASVVRWAAKPCAGPDPGELALADALSWLPERVAVAARRGRPDEFARYLAQLAYCTIGIMRPGSNLDLAAGARTGLAAGLGLLGIGAPDRL